MFKYLFILALGIAMGYGYGWKDAHQYEKHVAERIVDRIGGDNKDMMDSDVDAAMRKVEGR